MPDSDPSVEVARATTATRGLRRKRVIDTVLALLLLLAALPLLLLIAVAIKVDSRGPVLFVQERVGARWARRKGKATWTQRNFSIYKFRTMKYRADQTLHRDHIKAYVTGKLEVSATDKAKFKLKNDPRITRVGRVLRRTSLDELPQLVNILKGEMSLVGPRPVPTYEVDEYEAWQRERLLASPGITGLWQVRGRGRVTFEESIRMDIEYVRKQSLWLDLQLLLLTFPAIISGRGSR